MPRPDLDRELLFGLLAVQTGLVDREALVEALRAWTLDRSRSLADLLAERGALLPARREILEGLIAGHVAAHGGDPTRSLAAVVVGQSTLESLRAIADPDLDATLEPAGSEPTEAFAGERAATFRVGPKGGGDARFRVIRLHARGGLGAVFVALDSELNREVALKQILDRHADDPASRSRFLLEAEITGGLEHPGIVPVYGLGHHDDGRPYYAMRFIKGDSLKEAIADHHRPRPAAAGSTAGNSRELDLRKLLRRFVDVCNAIEYAHRRGVLHRDLKPGNVMVGKYGETLVVDWGLAKALGQAGPDEPESERALAPSHSSGTAETLPGSALGTPSYMSPEQADGDLARIGPRSDVYSLGATLYCLLTGHPPFEGPEAAAILHLVRRGMMTPPRGRDPSIDRGLEAVCLKAMALDPSARYPTPASLAEEVERWMADEPVAAYPEPRARRLARWARRHTPLVASAGAVLAASIIALGLILWLVAGHNRRLEAANGETRAAGAMAHKAVRTMLDDVASTDLLNIPQGEPVRVALAERALAFYRDFGKLHPGDLAFGLEHARVEEQVASLYRMTGQYARARVEYASAIARLEGLRRADPGSTAVLDFLSYTEGQFAESIRMGEGTDAEAEPHYREAAQVAEGLRAAHPEAPRYAKLVAVTLNDLAGSLTRAGRLAESEPILARAVASAGAFDATLPPVPDPAKFNLDRVVLPLLLLNRADLLSTLGRPAEAEASARTAVTAYRTLLAAYPHANDVKQLLAKALDELAEAEATDPARRARALANLDEAVGLVEPLLVEYPRIVYYPRLLASLRANRGEVRLADGRLEPARVDLAFADASLVERVKTGPAQADPLGQHARVKAALARLAALEGDPAKARGLADEAVDLQRRASDLEPARPSERACLEKYRALRKKLDGPAP